MIGLLIVNTAMALLVLALSHNQATQNALAFYPSTLITMLHAAAAAAVALVGLLAKRIAYMSLVVSSILLITLPVSCLAGGSGYPGGDDGGGLGWLFFVGCSSLLAMIAGIGTVAFGVFWRRRKQQRESDDLKP